MTLTPISALSMQFDTPYLLIDEARFQRNLTRLNKRIDELGCRLRPHLKTLRSVQAAQQMLATKESPATVSTLAEAEAFAAVGYSNLLYGVGISPQKLPRVAALIQQGVNLHILLDSLAQAQAVIDYGNTHQQTFSVFIEIDCDGHRGGIQSDSQLLLDIVQLLQQNNQTLTGLMTHAGESYGSNSTDEIRAMASQECDAMRQAAERVRAFDTTGAFSELITSVGSTPTAHFVEDLSGISEVRAGVFSTFDLVMKNLGVCTLDDIAMSVVTSVIGHNPEKGWLLVDAGWMALSRDRGTAGQAQDYGYGLVCNEAGEPFADLIVDSVNQEHGIVKLTAGHSLSDFPVGTQLRILPNHACATAAMHQRYVVLQAGKQENQHYTTWDRILGW